MKKHIIFKLLSGFFGIVTFILLIWLLLNNGSGISFATFAFWTLIVGINTIVTIKEKGNFVFPLVLTLGNLATSITILVAGQFWWGLTEWVTLIFVLISIFVWITSSRSLTIIVSTIVITIGGIPQLVLTWNNPSSVSIPIWTGFLFASIFGILAGKEWSIKERLYSTARMLLYGSIIIIAIKRFL